MKLLTSTFERVKLQLQELASPEIKSGKHNEGEYTKIGISVQIQTNQKKKKKRKRL